MSWQAKAPFPGPSGIAFQWLIELNNGKILQVGGEHTSSGVEVLEPNCYLYDPTTDSWAVTGSLGTLRVTPMLVKLNDGRVLAIGGRQFIVSGNPIASCEIYDPATGLWTVTGSMGNPRYRAANWLLPNGDVLVAGGASGSGSFGAIANTERYSVASGTWTDLGQPLPLTTSENYFFSLTDGTPVIAGGQHATSGFNGSYQWHSGSGWTSLSAQPTGLHASDTGQVLVLSNGDIMLTGAASNVNGGSLNDSLSVAMIFHQDSKTWETVGNLNDPRQDCILGALSGGAAFVTSGFVEPYSSVPTGEVYDPVAKTWSRNSNYALAAQQTFASYVPTTVGNSLGVYTIGGWDLTQPLVNNLEPAMTANQFQLTRSITPMSDPNSMFPVVYDANAVAIKYVFPGGNVIIPETSMNAITGLTGDISASGPGSVSATLATVNSNVGSFTSANITVDAKGRITAASNGSGGGGVLVQISQTQSTASDITTSTSFVAGSLTKSFTGTATHQVRITISGVGYLSTGGDTAVYTVLKDGTPVATSGCQEYSATAGGTIFPVSFICFDTIVDNAAHTYAIGLKSDGGHSVQFGTGDVTKNWMSIEEFSTVG